jgi:phosphotransferase system HPr (HPr) family protein
MLRRVVRIVNPLGLHHRVADRFARTANGFDAKVVVRNGELTADGKSLWDLMMLLAFEGTDVVLELEGPEAPAALEPLAGILAARGGEDYSI